MYGVKVAIQLGHAGREASPQMVKQQVAPSAIPCKATGGMPRELTMVEVEDLVKKFVEGARRAKMAGFDAVEIHGAHGYLINSFMSPYTNKRIDKYGGSFEGRMRFPLEIIEGIRKVVGEDFPIIFRLSGDEFVDGGLTIEDTKKIAKVLEDTSVNAIDVSAGIYESIDMLIQPMYYERGCIVYLAEKIKKSVNIPVITVGRINDPILAEKVLQEGKADFVAIGRGLIADPEFAKKTREGRLNEIRKCIACNYCISRILGRRRLACTVNPEVGKEREYKIRRVEKPKKVLVVGGGPAGMEAARIAALRGHKVTLCEKTVG